MPATPESSYVEVPTTEITFNHDFAETETIKEEDKSSDEGVVMDYPDSDKARGLSGDLQEDALLKMGAIQQLEGKRPHAPDYVADERLSNMNDADSGLSSRVSEPDAEKEAKMHWALSDKTLVRRLRRISEATNDPKCDCGLGSVAKTVVKVCGVFIFLYIFICTLDLLGNAFRLLGGKTAGSVFRESELLGNPITGLMIGVLSTVILQSSSTSSSIVITMVASKIIDLRPAIPIIMGANIGTTVTNTLVSLAHSMQRKEFRRAFSGAVVHDVFNWLTVLILLPLEYWTGYLYRLTGLIISGLNMDNMKAKKQDLLKKLTKPLTSRIVQVDKKLISKIAQGKDVTNKTLLKVYCTYDTVEEYVSVNETRTDNVTGAESWEMVNRTVEKKIPLEKCESLFSHFAWSDTTSGIVLLALSITCLSLCLYGLVKLLHSLLGGHIAKALRKTINSDLPRPFGWLTGYLAIILGALLTILVQSSSVFTSALTPLVGIGCLKLERMYPLTLGSNIGTTFTGILAALASSSSTMHIALQLAFCHLFFNITGIAIFFPVPKMRRVVLNIAKFLGRTTARYRWFAIAYLICMFVLFPGFFFAVSFAGKTVFIISLCVIASVAISIVCLNVMQRYPALRALLPEKLRTWEFLPECMRSLAPFDRCLGRVAVPFSKCCCTCCVNKCSCLQDTGDIDLGDIDSDSESDGSVLSSYLPSAVSSKAVLYSRPDSSFRLSDSSRKIYKPSNPSSRRNSGSLPKKSSPQFVNGSPKTPKSSPKSRLEAEPEPLLQQKSATFFISKSDANLTNTKPQEEVEPLIIDMSAVKLDNCKESKI